MAVIPNPWQVKVLDIPHQINLGIFGGRGAGRTTCALLMSLIHADKYGHGARVLFIRQTLRSLREVEDNFQMMLSGIYGSGLRVNRQDHIFILPNGATIEFSPLNDVEDMAKLQGRSFTLVVADEYGNFSPQQMKFVDQLRANLRSGAAAESGSNIPTRFVLLANPGGRGHSSIKTRFIDRIQPWMPSVIESDSENGIPGTEWVLCPATWRDNPKLPASYESDLFGAALKDKELFRAWSQGEWNIARGAMFADCIDEEVHLIHAQDLPWAKENVKNGGETWQRDPTVYGFVACDWGQSSPSVAFACWKLLAPKNIPDILGPTGQVIRPGRSFPRGSLILADEVTSADPDDWSVGRNWSVGKLADAMGDMCDRVGVYKIGCIDDARGLGPDDTLIKGMNHQGFSFKRPAKNRRSGWAAMREMLVNAREKNGKPGMWVADRCTGWWETVPLMPRDPLNMEDVDTKSTDHWGDTNRYAATYEVDMVTVNSTRTTLFKYGIGGPGIPRFA